MFVPAMTFEEIRKEFDREKDVIMRKTDDEMRLLQKSIRKYNISRMEKFRDYVSPRKNRWLIRFTYDAKENKHPEVSVFCHYAIPHGYGVVSYSLVTDEVIHFTSHFFSRYYQRTEGLEKDDPKELIKKYIKYNDRLCHQLLDEVKPGVNKVFAQQTQGVALGNYHRFLKLFELRTFIGNDMLNKGQLKKSNFLEEMFNLPVMRNMKENGKAA